METVDFPSLGRRVGQQRQKHVNGVKHDSARPYFGGLRGQNCQHAAEVEAAGLNQVGSWLGVQEKQFMLADQFRKVPTEALGVGDDAFGFLFKGDKYARLLELPRAVYQEAE